MFRFVVLIAIVLTTIGTPAEAAPLRESCFTDTPRVTACYTEPFVAYWEANGGLPVFGYPLTGANVERNQDLNAELLTQWTERNRFEVHPENQAPYNILLGRMGADRLKQLGRDPQAEGRESGPQPNCLWFEQTGHNVCDQGGTLGFKTYWQSHGLAIPNLDRYNRSLQLFGLPLTAPKPETNAAGDTVLTQWFERARFEWHPNKPDQFKVLLGLLGNEVRSGAVPAAVPIFGAEIYYGSGASIANRISDAGLKWSRMNGVEWSKVEPTRGARDWAALAAAEADFSALSGAGTKPIVIVRSTPAWAQKVPGSLCGPIRSDALDAFAAFMGDLVARYKGPPYNVHHWELGNEPDIAPNIIPGDSVFGCWGDEADAYYGGGYYAEMLKRVYPAIKRADPTAQVVLGGLLLDCDPTYTYTPARSCQPARFLEGVLRSGGGTAFDLLSYHGYPIWSGQTQDDELNYGTWQHRGGVVLGKLSFIQSILRQYNVVKPIILTEGGMICYRITEYCPSDPMRAAQANYVVRMYTRAWGNGLVGAIWFTLNGTGYREGGLLDEAQAPRSAYTTLKFLTGLLNGATYMGPIRTGGSEGYLFQKGATSYRVVWMNTAATTELPLPAGTRTVYNYLGQAQTTSGSSIRIGFDPVIIESR